jgi:Fe-S-cluster-containing hydrogenase component 2
MKDGKRHFEVNEAECVGCNLCALVCPVPECITLRSLVPGETDLRTGKVVVSSARGLDHTPQQSGVPGSVNFANRRVIFRNSEFIRYCHLAHIFVIVLATFVGVIYVFFFDPRRHRRQCRPRL